MTPALPVPAWEVDDAAILHHEESFIAIAKPAGLPAQATRDPTRDHVVAAIARYLERAGWKGRPMLHHRLDAQTSGVMIVALRDAANPGLARAFREREVSKTYLALVARGAGPEAIPAEVRNHLRKVRVRGGQQSLAVRAGGDLALTRFRRLGGGPRALEVEAAPHTGRMHQIRVHLADLGHPILGDPLYGAALLRSAPRVERLMLHASRLSLPHPLSAAPLVLEAPLPEDYLRTRERWIDAQA